MAVGSERGTSNLDVLAVDQLYVAGTITGSVFNAGTETITQVVETNIDGTTAEISGTITGSFGNITHVNSKGTTIGTKAVFTTMQSPAINGSVVIGTTGEFKTSVLSPLVNSNGTVTGSFLKGTLDTPLIGNVGVNGTLTGSVTNAGTANITSVIAPNFAGSTITGSLATIATVDSPEITGSTITGSEATLANIDCPTFTGSNISGSTLTLPTGAIRVPTLKAYHSGITQVSSTPGTLVHGLGTTPNFVSIVPMNAMQGAAGTEGCAPYLAAASTDTNIFVAVAGTTGTVDVFALA